MCITVNHRSGDVVTLDLDLWPWEKIAHNFKTVGQILTTSVYRVSWFKKSNKSERIWPWDIWPRAEIDGSTHGVRFPKTQLGSFNRKLLLTSNMELGDSQSLHFWVADPVVTCRSEWSRLIARDHRRCLRVLPTLALHISSVSNSSPLGRKSPLPRPPHVNLSCLTPAPPFVPITEFHRAIRGFILTPFYCHSRWHVLR